MEENRENRLEKIIQLKGKIRKLPTKMQNVVYWTIENYSILEAMGKKSEMTAEEIQSAMETALAEEHYAMFVLLQITQYMKQTKENEEL